MELTLAIDLRVFRIFICVFTWRGTSLMIHSDLAAERLIYTSEWQFINSRWRMFLSARMNLRHLLEKPPWKSKLRSEGCLENVKSKWRKFEGITRYFNQAMAVSQITLPRCQLLLPKGQIFPHKKLSYPIKNTVHSGPLSFQKSLLPYWRQDFLVPFFPISLGLDKKLSPLLFLKEKFLLL